MQLHKQEKSVKFFKNVSKIVSIMLLRREMCGYKSMPVTRVDELKSKTMSVTIQI